ncbi:putative nuclease HARBI1 [Ornithodoros turicata]|uniref:putative nuclease HARBI1 n=1 Tax=Ornithodoros turicata TaxID=34597 RepID=UPI0031386B93
MAASGGGSRSQLIAIALLLNRYLQKQQEISALNAEIDSSGSELERLEDRMLVNSMLLTAALTDQFPTIDRQLWMHPRDDKWFEKTLPLLGEENFKQSLRVSPSTFKYLVDVCRPRMERLPTAMREAIPVEKRVAISLYRLGSSAEDRTVANLFSVGRSTVNEIFREFCAVIVSELEKGAVRMPTQEEMNRQVESFEAALGFPQAMGALDGCHFPVSPPKEFAPDYHNYKGWYSIILLALADHKYQFRYVNVGSPGRCHDSHVYHRSSLCGLVQSSLFESSRMVLQGVNIPVLILCDQAFPLTQNLMKPFPHIGTLTPAQRRFNYQLSQARRVVENTFGRLKARFRCVLKRMENDIENVPMTIRACCVLRNFCEGFSDQVDQRWMTVVQEDMTGIEQPGHQCTAREGRAVSVRNALAYYFHQREE